MSIINFEGFNVAVSRRRGNTCPLRIYVDGARLFGSLSSSSNSRDLGPGVGDLIDIDSIPVEEVAGVEVYIGPSEMPMEYNQFSPCGVILIWSQL